MSTLAAATASRSGAASIAVANRTRRHAERLAAKVSANVVPLDGLGPALAAADVVISCTGAGGPRHHPRPGLGCAHRTGDAASRCVVLDLAMPRDVRPAVSQACPVWW